RPPALGAPWLCVTGLPRLCSGQELPLSAISIELVNKYRLPTHRDAVTAVTNFPRPAGPGGLRGQGGGRKRRLSARPAKHSSQRRKCLGAARCPPSRAAPPTDPITNLPTVRRPSGSPS